MNEQQEIITKRVCLYVNPFPNEAGFFEPSIVYEGEPGHVPTGLNYGQDADAATWLVDLMNFRLGVTPDDKDAIVCSSMRAQNLADESS